MGKKIRIFKLAKELNIASDTLITFLNESGSATKNVNSPVDESMLEKVMEHFSMEKMQAENKEKMRQKRAKMRGEIAGDSDVSVDTLQVKKSPLEETKRPAILEALASLRKPSLTAERSVTVPEKSRDEPIAEALDKPEKVKKEKAATKKPIAKKKVAAPESEEVAQDIVQKADETEAETVDIKGVVEEVSTGDPVDAQTDSETVTTVDETEKAEEKGEETEPVAAEKADKERRAKIGETIRTIELPPEVSSKSRKGKKARREEQKQARKLSEKGKGLAEKIREQKQKETLVVFDESDDTGSKRTKKRKRVRKKKIDAREVDASIKETLAKMDESSRLKKYKKKAKTDEDEVETSNVIDVAEYASIAELASLMDVETNEVIKKCMELGLLVSINHRLDMDTLTTVADEFGFEVNEIDEYADAGSEEDVDDTDQLEPRPPVVTIMGHVDHGKTSLLDHIREANVVAGEKGGITQHIGAYEVDIKSKNITFLDTPGHEAFTAMRARGAQTTDIVVLVIAADDNVMPQTLEALNHAQAAEVPIIIAFNKIDKPEADVEQIKKQLADHNVLVESWGGKYQSAEISAKTGAGVDDLLELMVFQAELMDLKANPKAKIKGTVIESKLEKGRGTACTILVQNGTMKVGDYFVCGQYNGRIRAMFNERGKKVKAAPPSTPVQILGFSGMPQAGDKLIGMNSDKDAKDLSMKRQRLRREHDFRKTAVKSLYDISAQVKLGEIKELLIILKGDTDGSVEALEESLLKLSGESVEVKVIHKSIGAITEADVLLASVSRAIIIGFHVRPNVNARAIAAKENIDIRLYEVIYDAISDVKAALEGLLEPEMSEEIVATIEVRETFRVPKIGTIAGCHVQSGNVIRNAKVKLVRDGVVVHDGVIGSLRRFKDDVKEVASGFECGITLEGYNDIKVGDVFETYKIVETKRVLA